MAEIEPPQCSVMGCTEYIDNPQYNNGVLRPNQMCIGHKIEHVQELLYEFYNIKEKADNVAKHISDLEKASYLEQSYTRALIARLLRNFKADARDYVN